MRIGQCGCSNMNTPGENECEMTSALTRLRIRQDALKGAHLVDLAEPG